MRVVLLLLALGVITVSVPATAALHRESKAVVIRVIADKPKWEVLVDRPPRGRDRATKGDVQRVTWRLTNTKPQFGRPSNAVVGSCVEILKQLSASKVSVTQVAKLPGGTIRSKGVIPDRTYQVKTPVTGGTGAFANARGTSAVAHVLPDFQPREYRLQLP